MSLAGLKNVYDENRKKIWADADLRIWSSPSVKPGVAILELEQLKAGTKSVWSLVWKGEISSEINATFVKTLKSRKGT